MLFSIPFYLCIVQLASAHNPVLGDPNITRIETRDTDTFRSVAYFVNWVCRFLMSHRKLS